MKALFFTIISITLFNKAAGLNDLSYDNFTKNLLRKVYEHNNQTSFIFSPLSIRASLNALQLGSLNCTQATLDNELKPSMSDLEAFRNMKNEGFMKNILFHSKDLVVNALFTYYFQYIFGPNSLIDFSNITTAVEVNILQ